MINRAVALLSAMVAVWAVILLTSSPTIVVDRTDSLEEKPTSPPHQEIPYEDK